MSHVVMMELQCIIERKVEIDAERGRYLRYQASCKEGRQRRATATGDGDGDSEGDVAAMTIQSAFVQTKELCKVELLAASIFRVDSLLVGVLARALRSTTSTVCNLVIIFFFALLNLQRSEGVCMRK